MNIQNFQTFFSIFIRLNAFIEYIEIVKLKKLNEKLFFNLKNVLTIYFREFFTLIEIKKQFTFMYNKQQNNKKKSFNVFNVLILFISNLIRSRRHQYRLRNLLYRFFCEIENLFHY